MNKIKILLIENNSVIRNRIINIIKHHNDLCIIAVSRDTNNTLSKIHKFNPDVIFLDKGIENQSNLGLVIELKKGFPMAKIIVLDSIPIQSEMLQYLKAGASGVILKDAFLNNFLINIRTFDDKSSLLPPLLTDALFSRIVEQAVIESKSKQKKTAKMTKQEQQISVLLNRGLPSSKIGKTINLTGIRLKSAVDNTLDKLAKNISIKFVMILKLMKLLKEFPKVKDWSMINISAKYSISKDMKSPRKSNFFMILFPKNVTLFFYVSQSNKKLLTMQEFVGRRNDLLKGPELRNTLKTNTRLLTHINKDKYPVKRAMKIINSKE